VPCGAAVASLGGALGAGARCIWRDPETLAVVFGRGAALLPGERVRVLPGAGAGARAANGASDTMPEQNLTAQVRAGNSSLRPK